MVRDGPFDVAADQHGDAHLRNHAPKSRDAGREQVETQFADCGEQQLPRPRAERAERGGKQPVGLFHGEAGVGDDDGEAEQGQPDGDARAR